MSNEPTTAAGGRDAASTLSHDWAILAVLCLGQFLVTSSLGTLNIALPSIQADLGATTESVQWIVVLYQIGFGSSLVLGGRMGDLFGQRRLFTIGVGTFAIASAVGVVATSVPVLAASRLLQGVAGGLAAPQSLALIHQNFEGGKRRGALSIFSMISGAAFLVGQVATGLLIEIAPLGLTWRVSLVFNLVIGGVTTVLAPRALRGVRQTSRSGSLDLVGSVLIVVTALLVLVPLIEGRKLGWPPVVFVVLAAALPIGYLVLRYETSLERRGLVPVVDLRIFRMISMRTGLGILVIFSGLSFPYILYLTITLQNGYNLDPLSTALANAPIPLGFFSTSFLVPMLMVRLGRRIFAASAVVSAVGVLSTSLALAAMPSDFRLLYMVAPLLIVGAGQALALSPAIQLCLYKPDAASLGMASGAVQTVQNLLTPVHIALLGTIYFGAVGSGSIDSRYLAALNLLIPVLLILALAMFILHWWVPAEWPQDQPIAPAEPALLDGVPV